MESGEATLPDCDSRSLQGTPCSACRAGTTLFILFSLTPSLLLRYEAIYTLSTHHRRLAGRHRQLADLHAQQVRARREARFYTPSLFMFPLLHSK